MKKMFTNEAVRQRGSIAVPHRRRSLVRNGQTLLTASLPHWSIPAFVALTVLAPAALGQAYPDLQAVPPPTVSAAQLGNALGTLVSTQTASGGAAISFTGLAGNAAYFLQCHGVQPATNSVHLQLEVGEGSTPSWETGGNYFTAASTINSQAGNQWTTNYGGETQTAILLDWSSAIVSNGANELAGGEFWFADLAAAGYKPIRFQFGYTNTTPHIQFTTGTGMWRGDTAAITALRLKASSGNISGTCNLFQLSGS